jgi:hypothetical protein
MGEIPKDAYLGSYVTRLFDRTFFQFDTATAAR